MRLVLEQRNLLDASLVRTAHSADHSHHGSENTEHRDNTDRHDAARSDLIPPVAAAASSAPAPDTLVVIDSRVPGKEELVKAALPGTITAILDSSRDGSTQIQELLKNNPGIHTLDIVAYGQQGQILAGSGVINADSVAAGAVDGWKQYLGSSAEIDVWGCDVAGGSVGQSFVNMLSSHTGAAVAASADPVGASDLGGGWSLETRTGDAIGRSPFSDTAVQAWEEVLDRPNPVVTLSGLPSTVLLGQTFTETVSFSNTATTAAGYGPFIDVFIPTNSADKVTLLGASFLGSALTVTPVVLSTNVAGHVGTLGALHPLALGTDGKPLFITAPAGTVAGDTMEVIQLPFGSFTPGQPTADVSLSLRMENTSELTSTHPSSLYSITAVGGFQYGADPLNNPSTDPSLRGNGSGGAGDSSAASGAVSASATVGLLTFNTTIDTTHGENEASTGPSDPLYYNVTVTPATAVTSGDPITGLSVKVVLPTDVTYTGGTITASNGGTATFTANAAGPDGGTVTVSYSSLSAVSAIRIPVYVPQFTNTGAAILDPVTGAPKVSGSAVSTYASGTWNPVSGSLDYGTPTTVSGSDTANPTFTEKSLAMQETLNDITSGTGSTISPGDTVQYAMNFQVSDYYGINSLQLQSVIGDGVTLQPGTSPVLTVHYANGTTQTINFGSVSGTTAVVNGQTVATSGTGTYWTYSRDNGSTGRTTVSFDVGSALQAALGTSVIQGGTGGAYGTLTFAASVLDKYTNTNIDPNTGSGGAITERDTVTSTATATANLLTSTGAPTHTPYDSVSDTSGTTGTVAQGTTSLKIVAVNGVAVSGTPALQSGDLVTYEQDYNLITGDYQNLKLLSFLPLPSLSVTDPNADGSSLPDFTTSAAGAYPAAGTYRLVSAPSGVSISSAATNATANSISFDLGDRSDPTNTAGQVVRIQYSAVISDKPQADGLLLTTQGQALFTDAGSTQATASNIGQVTLKEPELVTKTGIVSITNDAGNAKGTFTNEVSGASGDPTTTFSKAGSATVFTGSPPTTIGAVEDLNAAGVDGGDTARIVTTVQNTGSAPNGAFDVTLAGTLPAGVTTAQISNFTITRGDGTVMTYTKPDGTAASFTDFFTAGGIITEGPGNTAALAQAGDSSHRDILFVSYDIKLPVAEPGLGGLALSSTGTIVNFSSRIGEVAAGRGFISGGSEVGGSAAQITDDASTVLTQPPTLSKAIVSTDIASTTGTNVAVGETASVSVTLGVPEGRIIGSADATGHITITETLAPNTQFTGLNSVTTDPNVTFSAGTSPSVTVSGSTTTGQTVVFDFGTYVQNLNADAAANIVLNYGVKTLNGTNTAGTVSTDTSTLAYYGTVVPNKSVATTEVDPLLTDTISPSTASVTYVGQTVTFTSVTSNTGASSSDAYSTVKTITIPSGFTYVPGSLLNTAGTAPTSTNVAGQIITINYTDLPLGASSTVTYQVTADAAIHSNQTLTTSQTTTDQSAPVTITGPRSYTNTQNTNDTTQNVGSALTIVGEAAGTPVTAPTEAAPLASVNVVVGDIVRLHGSILLPEGTGTTNTVVTFSLPSGVSFTNDGTATLAFVSNSGIKSSTLDTTGTNASIQVSGNTANFAPSYVIPTAAITISGNNVVVNLGILNNQDKDSDTEYAVIELNGLVTNTATNTGSNTLTDGLTTTAQGASSATSNVTENDKQPLLTFSKVATAVNSAAGQVTYTVTMKNTGTATAYDVSLTDPQGSNENSISGLSSSGGATGLTITSGNGTNALNATFNLAVGATETFTYTATVTDTTMPVPDTVARVTYTTVSGNTVSLTSAGLTSTSGASGTATGERTGDLSIPVDTLNASSTQGLGRVSGRVWHDIGSTVNAYNPAEDVPMSGVTVTVTTAGPDGTFGTGDDIVQTTTTAADGTWAVALLPDGTAHVTLSAIGSGGIPSTYTVVYSDGQALGNPAADNTKTTTGTAVPNINFSYRDVDRAPVLTGTAAPGHASDVGGSTGGTVPLYTSAGVSDYELDRIVAASDGSYAGTLLTLQRYNGTTAAPNASDTYVGTGALSLSGGNVVLSGTTLGSYTITGGVLAITFNATATTSTIGTVITDIAYHNNDPTAFSYGLQFGTTINDANSLGYQGTGGVMTSNVIYSRLIDIAPPGGAFTVPYVEGNNVQTSVNPFGAVTVQNYSGPDDTFSSGTVSLTTGFAAGQDVLSFTNNPATMGNIAGSYNAATGVITLTSAGGTATAAQWQAALRSVTYSDTSDVPSTAARAFTAALTDKDTGNVTLSASTNTAFTAVDDSPVLNSGIALTVSGGTEDLGTAPSGAVGFLVSSIAGRGIGPANITDTDGSGVNNGGSTATPYGISVTANDTSRGTWYYSTDNGTTWNTFTVGSGQGLRLLSDANTRLYFQVTSPNFNGSLLQGLTFRAWDTFDGTANGTLSAMPATTGETAAANSAGASYSSALSIVQVTVTAVNDSPVANSNYVLASVAEDTVSPAGVLVSAFASSFSDTADAQYNAVTNPLGSTANTLAGIALTGNAVTAAQGAWQYSTDGGSSWNVIGTGLSDTSSLLLGSNVRLRFVPAENYAGVDFNGTPGSLSFRVVENGTTAVGSSPYTGNTLQGTSGALNGIDVSSNGGATEISSSTKSVTTTITAVNDAPVASGYSTSSGTEDTVGSGNTVASLMSQGTASYSDTRDTVTSAADGSTGTPLAGVAITGNAATAAQGVWQYSLDGGTTWTAVGAVSDTSAVVLLTTDLLRFVPAADFNGMPGSLTVHDSDGTGIPAHGAGKNVQAAEGGTGGFSSGTVLVNAAVAAVNDAPVGAATANAPTGVEDTAGNGTSVASLFGPAFNDSKDNVTTAVSGGSTANTLAGIAVVANTANAGNQGVWQYSSDNGSTWTAVGTVSDSSALLLRTTDLIRFVPVTDFNGVPPGLGARVIDNSTGAAGTGRTGADVSALSAPASGANITATGTGGSTAVASAITTLGVNITAVNDAPTAGNPSSVSATEDTAPPVTSVSSVLLNSNDNRDTVTTAVSGGSTANPLTGIAVTGNTAPATTGAWQYSTDGGTTWTAIGAVSDASALVLGTSDLLRFLPVANFNGTPPGLTFRAIDGSTGVIGTSSTTGAGLAANAAFTTDVSGVRDGGTTPVSGNTGVFSTTLAAVNDAPTFSGSTSVSVAEDVTSPAGTTVSSLASALSYSDAADNVPDSQGGTGGSTGTALANIAITANAATAAQGAWQYSLDGGSTWTVVGAVSDTSAVVLRTTDLIRFVPVGNYNGVPGNLTVRASDGATSAIITAGSGRNIQSYEGNSGGWSSGTATVGVTVTPVNDAPIAAAAATGTALNEDTTPAGQTVSALFGPAFSDNADQQYNAATNPSGSTANTLAGIVITVNTANPATQGAWQFSIDGGSTWTAVGTVAENSGLLLSQSALLRFLPSANWNGTAPALTAHLVDSSTGPVAAGTNTRGVDTTGAASGGTTAVSSGETSLTLFVTPVNDAPSAGNKALAAGTEDTVPAAITVSSVISNGNDNTDQIAGTPAATAGSSTANSLTGMAVTGDTATAAQGVWQYTTDGTTWINIPASVSDSSALVLGSGVGIRFLSAADFNGTPGSLTYRVIDGSTGVIGTSSTTGAGLTSTAAFTADVSGVRDGGTTPVSGNSALVSTYVTAVNDPPSFSGTASVSSTEDVTGTGIAVSGFVGSYVYSDARDTVTASSDGSTGTSLAAVAVIGNAANAATQGAWQFSTDGGSTWQTIPASGLSSSNATVLRPTDYVRFVPVANYNGVPGTLTLLASDGTSVPASGNGRDISAGVGNAGGWSSTSGVLSVNVASVNDAPVAASSASGSALNEDTTPAGQSVTALFGPAFSDNADQQYNAATNPSGSTANTLAGVVITVNTANPATQGAWQYSTDSGSTWSAVGTVAENAGLLLSQSALLRFVPVTDWNGTTPALTAHLVDSSAGAVAAGTNTRGVDTTGANSGGTTAVSSGETSLTEIVTPVNDAPTAGNTVLGSGTEDTLPSAVSVSSLLASGNDNRDQVAGTPAATAGSSSANTLTGVAITGDAATAAQGTWQYSTDGTTFIAVPTNVSDSNALVLGSGVSFRFVPAADFNGTPGSLTYRIIDNSTGIIGTSSTTGAGLTSTAAFTTDVSGVRDGGTTPVSGNTGIASTVINSVNDAPVSPGPLHSVFLKILFHQVRLSAVS